MIYCSLIDAFGWTWEYVDEEMTLPRLDAISKHWQRVPPLAVSVRNIATFLGAQTLKPPEGGKAESPRIEDLASAGFSGGGKGIPQWQKDLLMT